MKAEQFIKDYTKRCSNELTDGGYHEWMTPDQALKAVEIAIEEICEWLKTNAYDYTSLEYLPGSDYPQADVDVRKMVDDIRCKMK